MLKGKLHVGERTSGFGNWIYDENELLVATCVATWKGEASRGSKLCSASEARGEARAAEFVRRWNAFEELVARYRELEKLVDKILRLTKAGMAAAESVEGD